MPNSIIFSDFYEVAHRLPGTTDEIIYQDGIVSDISLMNSTSTLKDVRKDTWKAFCEALSSRFSQNEINHVCERYGYFSGRPELDWEKMQSYSGPLQRRHIEYFGVGAAASSEYSLSEFLEKSLEVNRKPPKDLGYLDRFYQLLNPESIEQTESAILPKKRLNECNDEEIRRLIKLSQKQKARDEKDPQDIKGGPLYFSEHMAKDYFSMDQQRCNLFHGIGDLISNDPLIPRLHPYYSRLSMGIVSKLETDQEYPDVGILIPVPGEILGQVNYYKVFDIISYGGLSAIALVPVSDNSSLPPLLVFRCTQQTLSGTDSILSVLNDVEKNMGEKGYRSSKAKLDALMQNPAFTRGGKINVICYSLGGAHAGYFLNDHWRKVDEFVGFNFVGNNAKIIENLAKQINELPAHIAPPRFYIYRNDEDWVNKAGQKHIGWGINHPLGIIQVAKFFVHDYPLPSENVYDFTQWGLWLDLHAVRPLDSKSYYDCKIYRGPTLCNPILDTYKKDSRMEDARLILGNLFLNNLIIFLYSVFDFIFRILGIEFFRRNVITEEFKEQKPS